MKRLKRIACHGGWQEIWQHDSAVLGCSMRLAVYLPPNAEHREMPVLYWLSGLTCSEQNVITKAGAQRYAAEHGVILVCPDTSPRGEHVADDEAWDLGKGAGFYVNASQAPWAPNYRMYDYVVDELPRLIGASFRTDGLQSIFGHSMGGHGALIIALKNPGKYCSVSAFAPIVAPCHVPWGHKAFSAYLGSDRAAWAAWDTCALIPTARERLPLLVDQGDGDGFLVEQLQPQRLVEVCQQHDHPVTLRMQPGYDHSYYFIASFIGEHIAHHAQALRSRA